MLAPIRGRRRYRGAVATRPVERAGLQQAFLGVQVRHVVRLASNCAAKEWCASADGVVASIAPVTAVRSDSFGRTDIARMKNLIWPSPDPPG